MSNEMDTMGHEGWNPDGERRRAICDQLQLLGIVSDMLRQEWGADEVSVGVEGPYIDLRYDSAWLEYALDSSLDYLNDIVGRGLEIDQANKQIRSSRNAYTLNALDAKDRVFRQRYLEWVQGEFLDGYEGDFFYGLTEGELPVVIEAKTVEVVSGERVIVGEYLYFNQDPEILLDPGHQELADISLEFSGLENEGEWHLSWQRVLLELEGPVTRNEVVLMIGERPDQLTLEVRKWEGEVMSYRTKREDQPRERKVEGPVVANYEAVVDRQEDGSWVREVTYRERMRSQGMRQIIQTLETDIEEGMGLEPVIPRLGLASFFEPEFEGLGEVGVRLVVDESGQFVEGQEDFGGERRQWLEDYHGPLILFQGNLLPGRWLTGEEVFRYLDLDSEYKAEEFEKLVTQLPEQINGEDAYLVVILDEDLLLENYEIVTESSLGKFRRVKLKLDYEGGEDLLMGFGEN